RRSGRRPAVRQRRGRLRAFVDWSSSETRLLVRSVGKGSGPATVRVRSSAGQPWSSRERRENPQRNEGRGRNAPRDYAEQPMTDLRSAPPSPLRADDHVRGPQDAPVVLVYADFTCPRCAVAHERLRDAPLRRVFRHLALRAKHPRAIALARAAEAADAQGAFWPFHD